MKDVDRFGEGTFGCDLGPHLEAAGFVVRPSTSSSVDYARGERPRRRFVVIEDGKAQLKERP